MRILALSVLSVALYALPSAAQSVPAFSVEVTAGSGNHTGFTSHAYYKSGADMLRLAGTIRLGGAGRVRPILTAELSDDCGFSCNRMLVCQVVPSDGSCYQTLNATSGSAIALGVAAAAGTRFVGAVAAGVAKYAQPAAYVGANASYRLVWRLSAVADARYIRTSDGFGERTWVAPLSVGFRFY